MGKVWKEPSDNGLDRASFPLTLVSRRVGQAFNCVGTFVYNQNEMSNTYLQCSQETAPLDYPSGNMRVMLSTTYQPKPFDDSKKLIRDHYRTIEAKLPVHPLQKVDRQNKVGNLFDKVIITKASTSLGVVVMDGNIYLHPPRTRHGNYPYPYEMRHGVFSVTKTMVGALSMFYLAQRYGEGIFNERITDYVPVLSEEPGWQGVTFFHAFNMATGTRGGDHGETLVPFVWTSTAEEGIKAIKNLGDSAEAPGERFNYASTNTFVLSYAMQKYVEKKEGKGVYYWDLVRENVLKPINAQYLAVQHTEENDGSKGIPVIGWGAFPTVDETAKIAILLLNEGKYKGQQLLHKDKIREALSRTEWTGYENYISWSGNGVPGSYNHSFWSHNVITEKCSVKISYMAGHGANYVAFLPSNVILIRFMDEEDRDFDPLVLAVEEIRTSCK
ncbi:MAG: serine hydrolase domain-containing protein [Planctomycetota bacterium]